MGKSSPGCPGTTPLCLVENKCSKRRCCAEEGVPLAPTALRAPTMPAGTTTGHFQPFSSHLKGPSGGGCQVSHSTEALGADVGIVELVGSQNPRGFAPNSKLFPNQPKPVFHLTKGPCDAAWSLFLWGCALKGKSAALARQWKNIFPNVFPGILGFNLPFSTLKTYRGCSPKGPHYFTF